MGIYPGYGMEGAFLAETAGGRGLRHLPEIYGI